MEWLRHVWVEDKEWRGFMSCLTSDKTLDISNKTKSMHNFKELKVWQLSRLLVKEVYELTSTFPASEKYGLISQIRRCVVSIPTNISEGSGRNTDKDFSHFLTISLGSAYELETLLILSSDVRLISDKQLENLLPKISEIQKMTFGLIKTLRHESYV